MSKSITQDMAYRQSLMKYAAKYGVSRASRKHNKSRSYIYFRKQRWDGSVESLARQSRRPHSHPNQHTEAELKLIRDMRRRNPHDGLVRFWIKLRQRSYTRAISGLYKVLRRIDCRPIKLPNPKYVPKPHEQMTYPGQRGQIDVKYVPSSCLVGTAAEDAKENGGYYYQYTFIDEYSRFRYLEAFKEKNTYTSTVFLKHVVEKFPYAIERIQADNGFEFTNKMGNSRKKPLTLFEKTLAELGIQRKKICPFTPRHNGKVERSHRKDNAEFYACHKFYSFEGFKKQLAVRQYQYNNFPTRPLGWKSPKHVLFLSLMCYTSLTNLQYAKYLSD